MSARTNFTPSRCISERERNSCNASAKDEELRSKVMAILSDRVNPQRSAQVEQALQGRPRVGNTPTNDACGHFLSDGRVSAPGIPKKPLPGERRPRSCKRSLASIPNRSTGIGCRTILVCPHPILAQTYVSELLNVGPLPSYSWDTPAVFWRSLGIHPICTGLAWPMKRGFPLWS